MSSNPNNQPGYAPPPGPPPSGTAQPGAEGQPPQADDRAQAPPGQPAQPQGAYPGSGYAPPPGPPPGAQPVYYLPPGQYPGYYPPPQGIPYGAYPPPGGYYPPPNPPSAAPSQPPPSAPGSYAPPPGPPPPGAAYPPPSGPPYGYPQGQPGGFYQPPPAMPHQAYGGHDPLIYLGAAIPDPYAPPAAHGVQKVAGYDPTSDYNDIVRATQGDYTDDAKLIRSITNLSILQRDALNDFFLAKSGISLIDKLDRASTGNFSTALRALALGPLWFDVDLARKALSGVGTNEMLLVELVLGRPGHEIRWLKAGYKLRYGKDLVDAIKSDLSGKTERMFVMALNTQKPDSLPYVSIDQAKVEIDVEALHVASKKKDEIPFFEVLINRSDYHLGAVINTFGTKYKSLSKIVKKTFSGTIENGLLHIIHGVKPKRDRQGFWRDAKLLEKSMAGLGTKDFALVYRLVRAHWNPARIEAVKDAYKRRYGKALENRVKGETSGAYRDLLIVIVKSGETVAK